VSWDSRLLLFELDPARAHPLERQFAMGIGPYASSMVATRPFAESREFDANFAEIAVIYGKFI